MKKNKEYTLTKAETNYLLSTYIFAIWPEIYKFDNNLSIKPDIKATIKEELRHFIEEYTPSKISKYFKDKYYDIEITIKLKEDQRYTTQRYLLPTTSYFYKPLPKVSADKIIPNIKKYGKGVKTNASK